MIARLGSGPLNPPTLSAPLLPLPQLGLASPLPSPRSRLELPRRHVPSRKPASPQKRVVHGACIPVVDLAHMKGRCCWSWSPRLTERPLPCSSSWSLELKVSDEDGRPYWWPAEKYPMVMVDVVDEEHVEIEGVKGY
ncbi:hypothetical protein VPH35_072784 [Triticum aestivum]